MKIGIISDTHGYLEPKDLTHFKQCDELWHAGDIGNLDLLDRLNSFKPTKAVYGNIDGHELRRAVPENQILHYGKVKVLITHIAGKPPRYNTRVMELIKKERPNLLVCGHSHILKVEMDRKHNLLFMNPGAAGRHGFHKIRTLLRFEIIEDQFKHLEVIELGSRSK